MKYLTSLDTDADDEIKKERLNKLYSKLLAVLSEVLRPFDGDKVEGKINMMQAVLDLKQTIKSVLYHIALHCPDCSVDNYLMD